MHLTSRGLRRTLHASLSHRNVAITCTHARPVILSFSQPTSRRSYYTPSTQPASSFSPAQSAILSAAFAHVPKTGFTSDSLLSGAQDVGYSSASTGLFTRGAYDLVLYHLITQRQALHDKIALQDAESGKEPSLVIRLKRLLLARLHANAPISHKLQEAFGLMSLAANIPPSLAELGRLSDDLWYLVGDISVDSSWYTKRASLAAIYASTEVFMSQDNSKGFKDTAEFLDRRLEDIARVGSAASSVTQWLSFTGLSSVHVLRSWGVRI